MNTARGAHGCANVLIGGKSIVFVAGGNTDGTNFVDSTEYLDLNDIEAGWKIGNPLPSTVRGTQMITTPDKRQAYLIGGVVLGQRKILELVCNTKSPENCYFKDKGARTQLERMNHVAFLIPDSLADEYCNQSS